MYQSTAGNFRKGRFMCPSDKFERFETWLRENGAEFDSLELREYDTVKRVSSDRDEEEKKEPTKEVAEVPEESEMRGVHARTHIAPNTVCMVVPRKCLITVEMGQATPIGQAILHSDLDLDAPKHIFLMIYLLWDRKVNGTASFFYPYYEILPRTLKNMPIFWSAEELLFLEGSHLLTQIADRNGAITDDYHTICQLAPELEDICTLEEFKWARMCVCSRNFGLQIDGHRTSALVPHADMLNHYRPRETKWTFDDDRQAFTITTLQAIPPGAQVYDSYGQKCNHRFLLNYGFAVEDNRELDGFCPNEVPVELGLDPNDPLYERKFEFWTRGEGSPSLGSLTPTIGLATAVSRLSSTQSFAVPAVDPSSSRTEKPSRSSSDTGTTYAASCVPPVKRVRICVSNNENTRLFFSLLRVLACDEEELQRVTSTISNDGVASNRALFGLTDHRTMTSPTSSVYKTCRDVRHPINVRNERAAMVNMLDVVGRALSKYPTTLGKDVSDLLDERSYPRFSNRRHAKIQVKGEKEVLHHFFHWAQVAIDVIDVIERELEEERGVEVHLDKEGTPIVTADRLSFDQVIREMEDDDSEESVHHTIVRYCADVLGSLRREELRSVRRQKVLSIDNSSGFA